LKPAAPADIPGPPVIVIDPGHGGIDSGAIAPSGAEEKDVVLAVAKKLAEKLERTRRFRVVLTRYDDTFLPLEERVKMARMNSAALFISIHADSISRGEGEARGATVYTVSDRASDAEAAKLADKENKSDLIAGVDLSTKSSDVAGILVDLAHRETKNFSGTFARTLVGRMQAATRMHKSPLRSAGFIVLRAPDVPSVLLELGFLSHPEDVKLLASGAWRDRVTEAMVEAVQNFFESRLAEAR
jgi:N-acetylmuramoyl-L-alanine amidase